MASTAPQDEQEGPKRKLAHIKQLAKELIPLFRLGISLAAEKDKQDLLVLRCQVGVQLLCRLLLQIIEYEYPF